MSSDVHLAALRRAVDDWNNQDLDAYLQLYADDAVLNGYAGVEPGKASIRRFYEDIFSAFSGSRLHLDDAFAHDDKVVCRFRLVGAHVGPFQGLAPSGRTFEMPGITILRFAGGLCVERWSQADFLGLMTQLGALPAPAA
jgi:steroid delta-isomerase-like uncharacterized protein